MKKVVCFGEILWDMLPDGKKPGGAPMNVAFHLQKQGVNSTLISAVGMDENGKDLLDYLKQNALDTSFIETVPDLPTGTVDVVLDREGVATYTIHHPVAWDAIHYTKKLTDLTSNADALVYGTLSGREAISRDTLQRLIATAKLKILDMNLRPPHIRQDHLKFLLEQTDLLKINDEELGYLKKAFNLTGEDQELLSELGRMFSIETICVTRGEKGAMIMDGARFYNHTGYKVKVADTVGAGDAFLATLIHGILEQRPMEQVLVRANAVGALVATKAGANADYTENEIDTMCRNRF
ncbi:MAG TPA: carbohydrate kinase [Sphingobacteriaceae bacterium]